MNRPKGVPRAALAVAGLAAAVALVPAGLALAGGAGTSGRGPTPQPGSSSRPLTVVLTAHHSRFSPSAIAVPAGSTVRLVVRNLDPIDHELIVGGPGVHRRHEAGREAHHHGDVPGEVSVPAGTTVSTIWTAPAAPGTVPGGSTAPATGPVTFACHLPGHLAYGMAGTVEVTTRS